MNFRLAALFKARSQTFCQRLTPIFTQSQEVGGAEEDRTPDPLLAKQVLSQLSYSPVNRWWAWVDSNYRPHPYQGCALTN
jgi:hypothetical protein